MDKKREELARKICLELLGPTTTHKEWANRFNQVRKVELILEDG